MATCGRVLTIQDVNEAVPVLRLRLTNQAESLAAKKPSAPHFLDRAKHYAQNIFTSANDDIVLETEQTNEATERNKKKVDKIFDSMINKVNEQREDVKNELDGLTPQQQEDILTFWGAVQEFFMDLFQWLKDVFANVIEKIRAGWTVVKDAAKGLFDTVMNWFKIIF